MIVAELADGGKCGKPVGPGVGRGTIETSVAVTVPVPSPLNVRMPKMLFELENDVPMAIGSRLALKPAFGSTTPGVGLGSGVVPITSPGAKRQANVPVKP